MDCPPCTIQQIHGLDLAAVACFFGVLGLAAFVLLMKAYDLTLSIREKRMFHLHGRKDGR